MWSEICSCWNRHVRIKIRGLGGLFLFCCCYFKLQLIICLFKFRIMVFLWFVDDSIGKLWIPVVLTKPLQQKLLHHGRPLSVWKSTTASEVCKHTTHVAPIQCSYPSWLYPDWKQLCLNRLAVFGKAILAGLQGPSEKGVKNHQHQK